MVVVGFSFGSLEKSTLKFRMIKMLILATNNATSHEMYLIVDNKGLEKMNMGTTPLLVL